MRSSVSRRQFLARAWVLGAAVALAGSDGWRLPVRAADVPGNDQAAAVLDALARDTASGLAAFILPGPDPYSVAQGVSSPTPGAIDAGVVDALARAGDFFVPYPDEYFRPVARAFLTGMQENGIALPAPLQQVPAAPAEQLDDALQSLFQNDQAIPLTLAVGMLLNFLATQVNPASMHGQFLSPFSRLSFDEKAKAMEMLERPDPDLVAMIDGNLSEPNRGSVSGLLQFLGFALYGLTAFLGYGEFAVFDLGTRTLEKRPVGWDLSGYRPGSKASGDGWDELKGYYQGRREATG